MGSDELAETIKKMLARELEQPADSFALDTPLEALGIDSLDVVKLAARFEQEFNITITTDELLAVRTLGDILERLDQKIAGPASAP